MDDKSEKPPAEQPAASAETHNPGRPALSTGEAIPAVVGQPPKDCGPLSHHNDSHVTGRPPGSMVDFLNKVAGVAAEYLIAPVVQAAAGGSAASAPETAEKAANAPARQSYGAQAANIGAMLAPVPGGRAVGGLLGGAERAAGNAGKSAMEKAAAEKATVEKATAEKATAEKAAAEKATAEKTTAEKTVMHETATPKDGAHVNRPPLTGTAKPADGAAPKAPADKPAGPAKQGDGGDRYRSAAKAAAGAEKSGLTNRDRPGLQSHSTSGKVRVETGKTGTESAHVLPQAVGKLISGYSHDKALTTLLPRATHQAFDRGWVPQWNSAVKSGREITAQQVYTMVSNAIRGVPDTMLSAEAKGNLEWRLHLEMYGELGLRPDQVIVPARH